MDTRELLEAFAAAWNAHDLEGLLSLCTPDCIFDTATGPFVCGARHIGKAALREAFPTVWRTWPDARWDDAIHVVAGARGFSEWTFRGTTTDGAVTVVRGVDIFEIRDGLIAKKDTFRKQRTA